MACACWVLYRGLKSLQLFGGGTLNSTGSAIADLNLKSQGHYLIRGGVIECNSGVSGNVPISCRVLGSNPTSPAEEAGAARKARTSSARRCTDQEAAAYPPLV
eukprot:1654257-Rhodomonas_salina.1